MHPSRIYVLQSHDAGYIKRKKKKQESAMMIEPWTQPPYCQAIEGPLYKALE